MKTRTFLGQEVKLQASEIGTLPNGDLVTVATDAAGSQIIIKGKETHLLSSAFRNHDAACDAAKSVMVDGNPEAAFGCVWTNLNSASLADKVVAIFLGLFLAPDAALSNSKPILFKEKGL